MSSEQERATATNGLISRVEGSRFAPVLNCLQQQVIFKGDLGLTRHRLNLARGAAAALDSTRRSGSRHC